MIRIEGLDRKALEIRENVFEGLVRKSIRMSVRALSADLGGMLTAATTPATPTLAAEPPPPVPTLTGAELGAVTAAWGAHLTTELYPYLAQTYLDAAAATLGAVENATSFTLAAVTDPFAVDYLRGAANRLRGIGDGVWTAVREELALGYAAGDDIQQLAARVRNAANVSTPRALVIARTEVISAANAGSLAQVQLGGFTDDECQKEWLATDDTHTRPAHREADGQRVGINQPFSVGDDYLQIPGDRTGRPDNVIGCRCSVAFVFDDDDDIVSGMDEPLTAGKKWTAADEAKIKRDSEGKFAKKAGSAAPEPDVTTNPMLTPSAPKPNTPTSTSSAVTVKDGSSYKHGEVVAVQEDLGAALVWDANLGIFLEWDVNANVPVINTGGMPLAHPDKESAQKVIDGTKKFKWTSPKSPQVIDAVAKTTKSTPTPTVTSTGSGKFFHINTNVIYKQKYTDGAVIAEKDNVGGIGKTRLTWNESKKKFELQSLHPITGHWDVVEVYGKGDAYKKFSKETGWQAPGALPAPPPPSPATSSPWKPVVDDDDDDDDDVTSITYDDLTKSVAKQADTMTAQAFGNWFNFNKTAIKDMWPDFDDATKVSMIDAAEGHETETGDSTIFDTIKAWTPGKLNVPKATSITPTFLAPKNDDPISVMAWADWVSKDFEKTTWDLLTEQQKEDMTLAAAKVQAKGLPQALSKIKQLDGQTSNLPGGLNSTDEYNGLTADKKNAWAKNLTKADWDSLTPDQQKDIFEFTEDEHATWGGLDEAMAILNLFENSGSAPTSTPNPSPAVPAAPPVAAPIVSTPIEPTPIHAIDAVEKAMGVKFVGDIGTPKTKVSYWQELTVDTANAMQEKMLEGGSGGWSVPQKSAVAKYTTSEGYQTMNAVLRNDVKQLKKFNGPQLASAVNSAKHLQTAMRPLTESVILHRGTGAHAFGFDSINVSTDELKKLQGKVIVDNGFVSTSVVAPTHISFDYAKKPIKVIVQAPEGTPALYVSAATPGYSHENELILGAGTSFHVNEVRAASAADKAAYGSHTEQVVTVTVVPSVKSDASTAPMVTPLVTTPSAPVATPSSVPMISSASEIWKAAKNLPNNTLIAVAPFSSPYIDGDFIKMFTSGGAIEVAIGNSDSDIQGKIYDTITTTSALEGLLTAHNWQATSKLQSAFGTSSTTLTPSASTIPGPPPVGGGTPLKINTNTIYKQTYAHGAVIAVKPGHKTIDGKARRLFWNANVKKFVLQQEIAPGSWAGSLPDGQYTFNKKDAYAKFSKETDWETPPTGMSALVTTTGPVTLPPSPTPVPSLSSPVSTPSAPKLKSVKAGVKLPKLDADTLQSQAGTIPTALTIDQRSGLYKKFKSFPSTGLTDSADAAFGALYETLNWHNETSTQPTQLNMLQLINVLDEQAAFYAKVTNEGALAKKMVTWLKTPAGQRFAQGIVAPSSIFTAKTPGVLDHPVKSSVKGKAKALLQAGLKDPGSIGTIKTTVTDFKSITATEAAKLQSSMGSPPSSQITAIKEYTGSSYSINQVLRGPGTGVDHSDEGAARSAIEIQNAMKPLPQSIIVFRGTDPEQFPGLTWQSKFSDIKKFEGTVIRDRAFLSTSVTKTSAFKEKKARLEIEVPEGTPAIFVKKWSYFKNEDEMLLAAGLKYHVISVQEIGGQVHVKLRVVP